MQEAEASQPLEGYKPLGFSKADFGNLCSCCRVRRGGPCELEPRRSVSETERPTLAVLGNSKVPRA